MADLTLADIDQAARAFGLCLRGALHPVDDPVLPKGTQTLVMLGPDEPRFWPQFRDAPEGQDSAPDPLDRWSKRIIGGLAADWGGTALFPSDGPPYPPFLRWAVANGATWSSPVGLLVHAQAGLWASFRGAVAFPMRMDMLPPETRPCDSCAAPCAAACPVQALGEGQDYDVERCRAHVRSTAGADCRQRGCLVRRACPVSANMNRPVAQAAFHMTAFLGE